MHPERALENLNVGSLGLVFSQSVLLALVESGMNRDEAYRIVQRASQRAIDERRNFRDVIESDDEVTLSDEPSPAPSISIACSRTADGSSTR